jgi:hypothetical protein
MLRIGSSTFVSTCLAGIVGPASTPGPAPGAGKPISPPKNSPLTLLARVARQHEFSEVAISQDSTRLALRAEDGSLLMRATYHTDVHLKQERVVMELTFAGETLGLTRVDFAQNGGGPIQLSLSLRQSWLAGEVGTSSQLVRPTRKAEEILRDLSKALVDVLRQRGNKNISVALDEEAVRSLLGDAKVAKLFGELLGLIRVISAMKLEAGPRDDYLISISGQGKPYLESESSLRLEGEDLQVELHLTILPPPPTMILG